MSGVNSSSTSDVDLTMFITAKETFLFHNITTTITSQPSVAASTSHDGGSGATVTVVILIILLIVVIAVSIFAYRYLKKSGALAKFSFWKPLTRSRKSSTSSIRGALDEQEEMDAASTRHRSPADDMFTIDDFDDNTAPSDGREEYFYDEVFSKSQFEDETTNNAMRQLYSDSDIQPGDEMLDLQMDTLAIKMDNYTPNSGRQKSS